MGEEPKYRRLTRARLRSAFSVAVASRSSLWLGPDHLLVIDTTGYTEKYKRFFFRDIQAFAVVMNQKQRGWSWALGCLMVFTLGGWVLYFSSHPGSSLGVWLIAAGSFVVLGLPLVLNILLGPTCDCHIRTAVQTEHLCSLKRLRQTQAILNRVRPLITAAQGGPLAGEAPAEAAAPEPQSSTTTTTTTTTTATAAAATAAPEPAPEVATSGSEPGNEPPRIVS